MTGDLALYLPWNDRRGRFSTLRAVAFAAAVLPGLYIAASLFSGGLAAEPFNQATHLTGLWAVIFLLASLAVTPLRRVAGWSRLVGIRRMLGLTAFAYVAAHFGLYILDQNGDLLRVATEIARRIYLTIGFVAFAGLVALAATSFDRAIRRMGPAWRRLHRAAYVIAVLGIVHFFLQSKLDVGQPVLMAGVFVGLMLYRGLDGMRTRFGPIALVLFVAVVSGLATAAIEALWYWARSGVPMERVLAANLDFAIAIRPMWWVMLILALPLPALLRRGLGGAEPVAGTAGR